MPATNSSSSQGTRRSGAGRRGSAKNPWVPIEEACGQVLKMFAAENAMTGVHAVDSSGDAIETVGRAVGAQIGDEIDWDPRVAKFFDTFGEAIIRAAKPARDMASAIRRAENERINNVEEGGARRRKWDIGAHD
jgi:cytochrome c5